jgi:hypothetical protein
MKKLACRLGRHDWTARVEGGEEYEVCAACGKTTREPGPPGELPYHPAGGVDPHPGETPLLPPPPE